MLTIERFYFKHDDAASCLGVGKNRDDYHLEFIGDEESPVSIRIVVRGRDEFIKLVGDIHSMALALHPTDKRDEADRVSAGRDSIPANQKENTVEAQ